MSYAVVPEAGPSLDNYKSIVTHVELPLKSSTEDDTKKEVIEVIDLCCDDDDEWSKVSDQRVS